MTEDEAKTKICCGPAALYPNAPPGCVGDECMAWRWSEAKRTLAFLEAVQAHMKAQPKPNFNTSVAAVYAETGGQFERTEGYCGLAGAPQ